MAKPTGGNQSALHKPAPKGGKINPNKVHPTGFSFLGATAQLSPAPSFLPQLIWMWMPLHILFFVLGSF